MKYDFNTDCYIHLLPGCEVVDGISRALVINSVTGMFDTIPLQLADIVTGQPKTNLRELSAGYEDADKATLATYLEFLEDGGYAFVDSSAVNYLATSDTITRTWDAPFTFTNAIIDFSSAFEDQYEERLRELGQMGCDNLQLRFLDHEDLETISRMVSLVQRLGMFYGLSIVASADCFTSTDEQSLEEFVSGFSIITEIVLFNADKEKFWDSKKLRFKVLCLTNRVDQQSCGAIHPFYFSTNVTSYSESFSHNSCLNRKIAIDGKGNIKNCPSMQQSFGNISDTTIEQATRHPEFKKLWFITKNEVDKCKACEFRRICTDCRAFLEKPADDLSAPLKCGYDPATYTWEHWSDNPLKQKAILHYSLQTLAV